MRRMIAVLFAVAVAMAFPAAAMSAQPQAPLVYSVPLIVDESIPGFILPQPTIEIPKGTIKFTAYVPESAKGTHGIGIDGGQYNDIKGAPVKPGRATSLTVALVKSGEYTVFDSYKHNRAKGYAVKVRVKKSSVTHVSYGKRCPVEDFFDVFSALWVKNVTCSSARKLKDSLSDKWSTSGYSYAPIQESEFNCIFHTASALGLKIACLAGDARVTWIG